MNDREHQTLVGRTAQRSVLITDALVRQFAEVVEDRNPLHLDDEVARGSRFGTRIAHGMLVGSLFSGLIARELPGPGSIYLSQSLRFLKPTPVGSAVRVTLKCTAVSRSRAEIETTVAAESGEILVEGTAVVLVPT